MVDPPSPSPSLELVHATAAVYKRFDSWLKRACKNYDELLMWKAVVNNVLHRERAKAPELDAEQRAKVLDALEEYDKLDDSLLKLARYKALETFGWTGENFIKWVGDEAISVGYSGLREGSAQHWLSDIPLTPVLPLEKKARDVLGFYGAERLAFLRIPTREGAESELLDFLENVKKWPRDRLRWLVKNVYPIEASGGFWSASRKVVELVSLWDAWEDIMDDWRRAVTAELKKMPQFEVLKTILMAEWEAEKYIERDVFESVKNELMVKYGETIEDPEKVKAEFFERAKALFSERTPVEAKIIEVYEEIKPLVPAEKVELTRAGLWKAIRWAFLHPELSVDAFASMHVFPLGFTTEEARAIGSKIMERFPRKPPVAVPPPPPPVERVKVLILRDVPQFVGADMKTYGPYYPGEIREMPKPNADVLVKQALASYELVPPPPPVPKLTKEEFTKKFEDSLNKWIPFMIDLLKPGLAGEIHYIAPTKEKELVDRFTLDFIKDVGKDDIEKQREASLKTYEEAYGRKPEYGEFYLKRLDDSVHTFSRDIADKAFRVLVEEAKKPPAVPAELPSSEIEILRGVVHMKAEEMKIPWTAELWDAFWREYETRARELWATKAISFIEEEIEDVLRVVSPPAPPPPPPVVAPPVPPAKRPLRELPEQVRELTEQLEKEAYSTFLALGLPHEEWLRHRGTIGSEIKSAIDFFGGLLKFEAEEKVRERVIKFVMDLIEKIKAPLAPPIIPPIAVPPPVEFVYAPREKPLSAEELKALQEEILGMPYEKAVDEYLMAITQGRTTDVEAWRKKFEQSSEAIKMKRRVIK